MSSSVAQSSRFSRRENLRTPTVWLVAIALFGVGDLVTTIYFIVEYGAVETHPVGAIAIDQLGLWILVPWKAAALALFYGFYRAVPKPYSLGVPIGLALLGAFTSAWNTLISTVGIPLV